MKVLVRKLKELEDALHPHNIEEGYEVCEDVFEKHFTKPTVGHRFNLRFFQQVWLQK